MRSTRSLTVSSIAGLFCMQACALHTPSESPEAANGALSPAPPPPPGPDGEACTGTPPKAPTRHNEVGSGTRVSPYELWNGSQLTSFGAVDFITASKETYYVQCADIDMSALPYRTRAALVGGYDGRGHSIAGLAPKFNWALPGEGAVGFIGFLQGRAQNMTFRRANIVWKEEPSVYYLGTLAGVSESSTVENVHVEESTLAGKLDDSSWVGGVVGWGFVSNFSDVRVDNTNVTARNTGASQGQGLAAGVVARMQKGVISRTGVSLLHVSSGAAGGLIALASDGVVLTDSKVISSTISGTYAGGAGAQIDAADHVLSQDNIVRGTLQAGGISAFLHCPSSYLRTAGGQVSADGSAGGIAGSVFGRNVFRFLRVDDATVVGADAGGIAGQFIANSSSDCFDANPLRRGVSVAEFGDLSAAASIYGSATAGGVIGKGAAWVRNAMVLANVKSTGGVAGGLVGSSQATVAPQGIVLKGSVTAATVAHATSGAASPLAWYELGLPVQAPSSTFFGTGLTRTALLNPQGNPLATFTFAPTAWALDAQGVPTIPSAGTTW